MIWVVDIGNSSIKWAEYEAGAIKESQSYLRSGPTVAEELDCIWADLEKPDEMICTCVAGEEFEQAFVQWCQKTWSLQPLFVHATEQACGVSNAYTRADRLGADRWAALVAAHRLLPGPSCIIDCGTATTIDVMQADGQHLGGLILPGMRLMRESLSGRTHMLVEESEGGNTTLFARNTADAINGGALYAVVATLDRVYSDVDQTLGEKVNRVITGGDAEDLLPLLQAEAVFLPDLVLQGLAIIYQSMQEGDR
jgi:type III pantothenate kinase